MVLNSSHHLGELTFKELLCLLPDPVYILDRVQEHFGIEPEHLKVGFFVKVIDLFLEVCDHFSSCVAQLITETCL